MKPGLDFSRPGPALPAVGAGRERRPRAAAARSLLEPGPGWVRRGRQGTEEGTGWG